MPLISSDTRFLGIDLALLWRDMIEPWRRVHQWPLFAWITPQPAVLLYQSDGQQSVWEGGKKVAARTVPQFVAVELPDEYVLRRPLRLPAMAHDDAVAAMALEARSASPFDASDLVWGYSSQGKTSVVGQQMELVIASRKQITQYLATAPAFPSGGGGKAMPEVWVRSSTAAPAVFSGYGETAREIYCVRHRRRGWVLLAILALGVGMLAVTPSIQLRARAIEAAAAYEDVAKKAAPAVRQREQLLASVEALNALAELTAGRIEPLLVLDKLTQVLPDDTALQSFKIQGTKLTFSGQTGNASSLMQLLGDVPGFKDVHAPTAATRYGVTNKEVFAVELTLDAAVFGVKSVSMAAPAALTSAVATPPESKASEPAQGPAGGASAPAQQASTPAPPAPIPAAAAVPGNSSGGSRASFGGGAAFGGGATAPAVAASAAASAPAAPRKGVQP